LLSFTFKYYRQKSESQKLSIYLQKHIVPKAISIILSKYEWRKNGCQIYAQEDEHWRGLSESLMEQGIKVPFSQQTVFSLERDAPTPQPRHAAACRREAPP
jgi:hypothetical protein